MAISNVAITSTGTDVFTCPGTLPGSPEQHAVTCLVFCNISASDAELELHVVPQGGTVGTTNQIINSLVIPAAETFSFDTEKFILNTGDKFHAIANVNSRLVVTVSSMRVS